MTDLQRQASQGDGLAREFEEALQQYDRRTTRYRELVEHIVTSARIACFVEARTKSVESFLRKVNEPERSYLDPLNEVHDISGVRFIAASLQDADSIVALLRDELEIDEERSIDKGLEFASSQFGYRSRHLICRVGESRRQLSEWRGIEGWVEIQVRTACQQAWAQVDRLVRYKTSRKLPPAMERKLFALAAVLEVCDSEIEDIFRTWTEEILATAETIVSDTLLTEEVLAAYLETSPSISEWIRVLRDLGVSVLGLSHLSRDVQIALDSGIATVTELERVITEAMPWGRDFFREFFAALDRGGLQIRALEINVVVALLVIASNPTRFSEEQLRDHYSFGLGAAALDAARIVSGG